LIHVSDACRGLELVLKKGEPGEIYNIGYGLAHSILQVAQTVHNLTGAPIEYVEGHEFTKFDVKQSKFDTTKARRELGFEAQVDLKKGIQLTLSEQTG
jgi:dTDP-glucose 4,6-dehydratase